MAPCPKCSREGVYEGGTQSAELPYPPDKPQAWEVFQFYCRGCGNTWTERFEHGKRVKD